MELPPIIIYRIIFFATFFMCILFSSMPNFSLSDEWWEFSGLPSALLFLKWLMIFLLFFLSVMVVCFLILWLLLRRIPSQSKCYSLMTSSEILQIINFLIRTWHHIIIWRNHCWPQPLKERIIKKGMVESVLLLSEFCLIWELLNKMHSYFPTMKDLFYLTQISSAGRAQEIESFMNELRMNRRT